MDSNKTFAQQLDESMSDNPNDYNKIKSWDELFELQARKDGANYHMLKKWLDTYFDVPQLKK